MQIYFPGDPTKYFKAIDETQPELLGYVFAEGVKSMILYFAIVTVMASGISAHAGVARLMYVMGRDGVINRRIFGHISPRFLTPTYNILIAGAIALTAGILTFEQIANLISFGALTAFSFVNISVIAQYAVREKRYRSLGDIIKYVVLPLLGFASVIAMWLEVDTEALQAGLIWGAIGVAYLAYKTGGFKRPAPVHHEFD